MFHCFRVVLNQSGSLNGTVMKNNIYASISTFLAFARLSVFTICLIYDTVILKHDPPNCLRALVVN